MIPQDSAERRRRRRRRVVPAGLLLLGVFAGGACRPTVEPPAEAIFLIVVDTLRPDRLSCYGYDGHATPHIDELSRRGVRFERAQSVASWTLPSMGAMMTSLYPTQLGLVESPAPPGKRYEWQELRDQANDTITFEETTLAEILAAAGFRSAAFVNQPGLILNGAFFQGFDDAFFPGGPNKVVRYDPETLEYPVWEPFLRAAYHTDSKLIERFDEWLAEDRDGPTFVWLHLLTPHWPYDPPQGYMPDGSVARTEAEQLEERFYNGEVRATDDLVGRITDSIERHVGLDASLVVFTSDHGEALGERGMHDHGHSLHTEVVRVPLIVRGASLPAGHVVRADARTIDVLPTILDLAGVADADRPLLEGTSLLPMIRGEDVVLPVYSEGMLYGSTERSLSVADFKLMIDRQADAPSLYRVASDPGETEDLAVREPARIERLTEALRTLHQDLVADRELRASGTTSTPAQREEMRRALRALGYVD